MTKAAPIKTSRAAITIAVAGRMARLSHPGGLDAVKPPGQGGFTFRECDGSPWGGLGGYPITPRAERAPWHELAKPSPSGRDYPSRGRHRRESGRT